jgi:alanine-glyoxylate transaminase/serine-glyoxylate transaminase/serine-pyruvate transaminase
MIRKSGAQADCVTTVLTPHVDALTLASVCENTAGLTIGLGVTDHTGSFRIGHMGHVNPPALLGALGTIEAGLRVVGAPLGGSGVASAAEVIAEAMATYPHA